MTDTIVVKIHTQRGVKLKGSIYRRVFTVVEFTLPGDIKMQMAFSGAMSHQSAFLLVQQRYPQLKFVLDDKIKNHE